MRVLARALWIGLALVVGVVALVVRTGENAGPVAKAATGVRFQSSSAACRASDAGVRDVFSAGSGIPGHRLTGIAWDCATLHAKTYVYGRCTPPPEEGGCAPPVQIQLLRVCERNPAALHPRVRRQGRATTLRGVPARVYERGTWVELYSGRTAIVVWADTPALGRATVKRLVGAGPTTRGVGRGDDLPPPVRGAVAGRVAC